jgi:hypothetical protein
MAQILRVIPNSLYERLQGNGILRAEFPSKSDETHDDLLNNIPITLRDRARKILELIQKIGKLSWNAAGELIVDRNAIKGSDIRSLLNNLVHQSDQLYNCTGHQEFVDYLKRIPSDTYTLPKYKPQNGPKKKTDFRWTTFEERFGS